MHALFINPKWQRYDDGILLCKYITTDENLYYKIVFSISENHLIFNMGVQCYTYTYLRRVQCTFIKHVKRLPPSELNDTCSHMSHTDNTELIHTLTQQYIIVIQPHVITGVGVPPGCGAHHK